MYHMIKVDGKMEIVGPGRKQPFKSGEMLYWTTYKTIPVPFMGPQTMVDKQVKVQYLGMSDYGGGDIKARVMLPDRTYARVPYAQLSATK